MSDTDRLVMRCVLRGLLLLVLSVSGSLGAWADDGFYFQKFHPVLRAQLDGALLALEKFGLHRVLLVPDPSDAASLEQRWRLLAAATQGDPRFVLPKLEDLRAVTDGGRTAWQRFWQKYPPLVGEHRQIFDRDPPLKVFEAIQGKPIFLRAGSKAGGAHANSVRLRTEPDQTRRFLNNPAMGESLLPSAVAEIVKTERLYGHDGSRGYYGLPDWLHRQLDHEQLLNDRIENTAIFSSIIKNDLPEEFLPENRPVFPIFHVDLPASEATVFLTGSRLSGVSAERVFPGKSGDKVRFFVHPHSKPLFESAAARPLEWQQKYWATPTSSHRSLVVWDPGSKDVPFAIKTTLDAKIGGSVRHLSRSQVERAAAVSALVNQLDGRKLRDRGMSFIDEPAAVVMDGAEKGFAFRELAAPSPGAELVPMFSLYSKPPGGRPLIVEMIEKAAAARKQAGPLAREFAERHIIAPMIEHFAWLAMTEGLVGEMHEQNVLMEVQDGLPTGRFFYRDLAGFIINRELRLAAGKDLSFIPAGIAPQSLKFERGDLVRNATLYLRQSNFHALQVALRPYFPEVTAKWMNERFRFHLRSQLELHLALPPGSLADDLRLWRGRLESRKPDCPGLFGRPQLGGGP